MQRKASGWGKSRRLTKLLTKTFEFRDLELDYTVFSRFRRVRKGIIDIRPENILLLFTLVAIILGTILGLVLNPILQADKQSKIVLYLQFPGELFLRMLKLMIIPLVISSNISSAASISGKTTRWLGCMSILYYLLTTLTSVCIGTVLALAIKPGSYASHSLKKLGTNTTQEFPSRAIFSFMDLIRNMIPENIMRATIMREATEYSVEYTEPFREPDLELIDKLMNDTNSTMDASDASRQIEKAIVLMQDGANILGLICFSIFFGFGLRKIQQQEQLKCLDAAVVSQFFNGIRKIMVYMVSIVIFFSPVGIMSLIASTLAGTDDLMNRIETLGMYTATVCVGLTIHGLIVLPLVLRILGKTNPIKFFYHMMQALLCALGTASSVATLPCTASCLENLVLVDQRVTRFMLPLGTTVNMDGTALYQAVAVIYIAQALDYPLTFGTVVLVVVVVCIVSVATASIPSAGLVTMMAVLNAIGIDGSWTIMVLAVDWFLDRLRTSVNVFSNSVGVVVIAQISKRRLIQNKTPAQRSLESQQDDDPFDGLEDHAVGSTLGSLPDVLRTTKQTFMGLDLEVDEVLAEEEGNNRNSIIWLENALVAGDPMVISDYCESEGFDPEGSVYLFRF